MARTVLAHLPGDAAPCRELDDAGIAAFLAGSTGVLWVDLEAPGEADYAWLTARFPFHQLAIEDCRHGVQRPKIDEYDDHLFFVFHAVAGPSAGGESGPETVELDGFLARRYLVTVHDDPLPSIQLVRQRIADNPAVLARGADDIFYAIIDSVVDLYFPILDDLDLRLDQIERDLFGRFSRNTLQEIFTLKKVILRLRRFAIPQRDTLSFLVHHEHEAIDERTRYYLRDVVDHLNRVADSLEIYRDLAVGAADTYVSQISNRTNDTMKVLSIIATIMLPLNFLAGLYGMNFEVMPGSRSPHGFWAMVAIMVLLAGGLLAVFRHKRWL